MLFQIDPGPDELVEILGDDGRPEEFIDHGLHVKEFWLEPSFRELPHMKSILGFLVKLAQATHKQAASIPIYVPVPASDPHLGQLLFSCGFEIMNPGESRPVTVYRIETKVPPASK